FYGELWQTISSGRVWHGEICNRKRAGDYYWVDATVVPLMGPDGLPSQYIAIRTDITDRKNIELSLEAARDVAEQASLAKGQFLANMSHELRTPMNAILGLLKLLQATALNDQQIKYTHQTEGAARSLLSLLNDILDFSKIEAGKMALDPHPFLIDQLLRDLSVILSASVTEKDLDVLFDIDSQVPRHLVGDAMRLQQVLINLGSNAIKFTSQGQVVVRLRVVERDAQGVLIEFAVQDSGIGIAPEHQVHIFTGFSQAEASTTRRFGGTGLGLAICRRLVALMGGVLQVESSQGIGSTFSFTVRLELGAQENIAISLKPAAALHALVVDDNAASRELMAGMAHSLGWSVDLADSGASALAMVQQSLAEGKPYEVVFVDWKMPGMDGWETSERMRALLANRSMILMVSAHGRDMLGQRSASERARLDGFLVKPVTASMLYDGVMEARAAMAQAASGMAQAAAAEPAAKPKRLDGLRLLVVEDNKINQLVAKGLLGQEGAVVTLADNGQLGVQALNDAPEYFDLVLMDVQMPVMDGFEATRIIRQTLALADLPVIAMTANAMASDREACLAAGMNDHVGKPFEIDHLVATVLHYVARDIA
ncbi:MAG: response regulator, partial [Rhodoferax sp.]